MSDQHSITYYLFDLVDLHLIDMLPFYGVSFGMRFNSPGSFQGSLLLSDKGTKNSNWNVATIPGKTLLIVDIDGTPVWAGPVWTRTFTHSSRVLQVNANECWSYFAHRIQAKDYTNAPGGSYWTSNPAPAASIAAQIVADLDEGLFPALNAFSVDRNALVIANNGTPELITGSFPLSQLQTVDSIVSNLASGGYQTGFDYSIVPAWTGQPGSTPTFTILFSFPRCGRVYTFSPLVVMIGGTDTDYTWPEDATTQAWLFYGTGGPGGILQRDAANFFVGSAGWPVLEATTSYSEINTSSHLLAAAESDLANGEWPVTVPTATIPLFGQVDLTDLRVGDDARLIIAPDEFLAAGYDGYLRTTAVDVTIADEGLSTLALTFNQPPNLAGAVPPMNPTF